ncbi:flavin-containing monooxygenase FMO GS-OX5-like isoform X3 [Hordeum vulgare subsp. vulgare]|uniref:flavin-containing monooxygenase FMO GS-OX5-like isoform X3 n=1 Tax=Hordeum vulgare subsp. vulgare TaxID=112509 RepID=UPI001D1A5A61|nr:flavin-containing monooxygenase FMO GS-OX5-like isoform X3 [Hordeum vulgare subsp. vulgare]
MPSRSLRVAVIGAGAAGLVAARELRREGHAPVVFERTDGVGGTWVYEADADASASPEPPGGPRRRSNLYASLRTNLPRESMGFLDFPFVAGADCDIRRFPGHAEVLRYLQSFARRFDLHGLVRLETEVVRVSREASGASWRVRYTRKASGGEKREAEEEVFDAVVVCNGHYSQPHFADVAVCSAAAGVDAWPGKQLHSTSYRVPEPFHGQVVVVIGCGPSGTDISRDIAGVAKEVHLASRSAFAATSDKLPGHANMWLHSEIECVQEDGSVVFHDGSRVKADVIMHCTGYKYNIPFLNSDATVSVDGNCVEPLYKHVFPPKAAPQLSFIGLPLKAPGTWSALSELCGDQPGPLPPEPRR